MAPDSRRIALILGSLILLAGVGAVAFVAVAAPRGPSASQPLTAAVVANIRDWAARQRVTKGTVRNVPLPPGLVPIANRRMLPIAHLKDGRYCFLLVTAIGYKDNFEGVLSCTRPLLPNEIVAANGTYASYVSLSGCSPPGCGTFEELYIRRMRDDRTYDVYFDLN